MKKGFEVRVDEERSVCFLKVWGLWSAEDGASYLDHFRATVRPLVGKKWFVVADISEFPAQRDEVNASVQGTMAHAVETGMVRAANVVSSAMTRLQIKRLSEETGLPEFSFFTSEDDAVAWLLGS